MAKFIIFCFVGITLPTFAAQDPTAPLDWMPPTKVVQKKKSVNYRLPTLQSIVCKDESPCYAILNGKLVVQGNVIRGYRVKHVNEDNVTVQRAGKQWKLTLFSLDIKQ